MLPIETEFCNDFLCMLMGSSTGALIPRALVSGLEEGICERNLELHVKGVVDGCYRNIGEIVLIKSPGRKPTHCAKARRGVATFGGSKEVVDLFIHRARYDISRINFQENSHIFSMLTR